MSSIVTFYSYKGGVGRSMALANIAVLLARRGLKVLTVDWDLEAPGLERYFSYFEIKPGGPGLLRMFTEARDGRPADFREFTSLVNCDTTHPITLLPSGREHDEAYSRNLEAFDWEEFFRRQGGAFVEELRRRWRDEFDIVLVDSRTGLSDTGGICTIQVPDIVVAMFTANYQSLYGMRDVIRLAQKARQMLAYDRMPLSVLPLPARWGIQEFQETQLWLDRVAEGVQEFFEDWLPRAVTAREVVERVKVPQIDYFGFGEKLAVVEQGTSDPLGMGFVYDKIASFLASDFKDIGALVGIDVPVETGKDAVVPRPISGPTRQEDYVYDIFVSHDGSMSEFVLDLVHRLKEELSALRGEPAKIFVDVGEIRRGESWDETIEDALQRSKILLAMITPLYSKSPLYAKEYLAFVSRARETGKALLIPVIVRGDDLPVGLAAIQSVDLRPFAAQRTSPSRRPTSWQREIMRLADRLNELIADAPRYDPKWAIASRPPAAEPDVKLLPVDLNLVIGDRAKHADLGPTINMTCRLSNDTTEPFVLHRLELVVKRNGKLRYHLKWHLFYSAFGRRHTQVSTSEQVTIGGQSVWEQGVQFRDSRLGILNAWPAGDYEFELRGWALRTRAPYSPNVRTTFRAAVDRFTESQVQRWTEAGASDWDKLGDPDRAVGFPLLMVDVRAENL